MSELSEELVETSFRTLFPRTQTFVRSCVKLGTDIVGSKEFYSAHLPKPYKDLFSLLLSKLLLSIK